MKIYAQFLSALTMSTCIGAAFGQTALTVVTGTATTTDPAVIASGVDPPSGRVAPGGVATSESSASFQELLHDVDQSCRNSAALECYSAVLEMEEEIGGHLRDPDIVDLKFRATPFSVYMTWRNNTQEALYVSGQNDGRLLIRPVKGLAAIKRVWRIEPDSKVALKTSRYSILDSGLQKLADRVREFYHAEQFDDSAVTCRTTARTAHGCRLKEYVVTFGDPQACPEYAECHYAFDTETGLLVAVENYGWDGDGRKKLVERYHYYDINTELSFSDQDFDHHNPDYGFVASGD